MKPCVIIPSFNGAKTIGAIVREIRRQDIDVIVVDDGSSDLTAQAASGAGARVLRNADNRGKGASLRNGFRYALDNGYDAVLTMDGDGQHLPADINNFLRALEDNPGVDMIIGNRMHLPLKMPFLRQVTNKGMSALISWICGQRIPDSQNGFRLIKGSLLKDLRLRCDRFEIESEMILEAAKRGAAISSIEITSVYENHPSFIHPWADTARFIRFILPYINTGKRGHKELLKYYAL